MKTANEIQLEALADAYDDSCCHLQGCRTGVENLIHLLESGCDPQKIRKYAKEFLEDIDEMIEGKHT